MGKITKKLSLVLVLAMFIGLFNGQVGAFAASDWSFRAGKQKIAVNSTVALAVNAFRNFDLYYKGANVTEKNDADNYSFSWKSSDASIIKVTPTNGKSRGLKAGTATVSATFTNKTTGKTATRSFTVTVGDVVLTATANDGEVLEVGESYELKSFTKNAAGEDYKFNATGLYRAYACDDENVVLAKNESGKNTITIKKAGTYTITVEGYRSQALADKRNLEERDLYDTFEVVAEGNEPKFTAIKQTKTNEVEITLNSNEYVKNLAADKSLLAASYMNNSITIIAYVDKITEKTEGSKIAVVTLYNDIQEDTEYTFTYKGFKDATKTIKGANKVPAKLVVKDKAVVAQSVNQKLEAIIYNAIGVDITDNYDKTKYILTWEKYDSAAVNYSISGDNIFFNKEDVQAKVKATLDMGYLNGKKVPNLTATGVYTSKSSYTISEPTGYALGAGLDAKNLIFSNNLTIAKYDDEQYLYIKYTKTNVDGTTSEEYIKNGKADCETNSNYRYESSNKNILLINEYTGKVFPIAEGTVDIMIYRNKKIAGYVSFTVVGERIFNSFTIQQDKPGFSICAGRDFNDGQNIQLTIDARDQLQNKISSGIQYSYKILNPTSLQSVNLSIGFSNQTFHVTETPVNDVVTLTAQGNSTNNLLSLMDNGTIQTFTIEVTAKYNGKEQKGVFAFSVKNVSGFDLSQLSTILQIDNEVVDTKLNQDSLSKYQVNVKLIQIDHDGYYVIPQAFTKYYSFDNIDKRREQYSIIITKSNTPLDLRTDAFFDATFAETGTLKISTVKEGTVLEKLDKGEYVIHLYYNHVIDATTNTLTLKEQKQLVIIDTSAAIKTIAKTTKISNPDMYTVLSALSFYRGNDKIADNMIDRVTSIDGQLVNDTYYVKSITIRLLAKEMNENLPSISTLVTVPVDTLFTISH